MDPGSKPVQVHSMAFAVGNTLVLVHSKREQVRSLWFLRGKKVRRRLS